MESLKKRKAWVKPDHKLTKEEIDELVRDFDYEGYLADFDDNADPEPSYDKYGNPSRDTLANMYEDMHDLGERLTLEELFAECNEWRAEVDEERIYLPRTV